MNISNNSSPLTSQSSAASMRSGGPPPGGKQAMSDALQSVGVDQSTASDVLQQIDDAISEIQSGQSSGRADRQAVQTAIDEVLESNGIDSSKVEEAIRANGPSAASGTRQASGAGRPNGPPPPPPSGDEDSETGSLESALLAAGVDESSTDQLIGQILNTLDELASESTEAASPDEIRSALTNVLQENGVDVDAFQRAIADGGDPSGLFMDRLA